MEQGSATKKIRSFVFSEAINSARDILDSVRRAGSSRADINRINEEMYRSPEIFSILMRLMEKTCKPFRDGRIMRAISENGDEVCQNYVNKLIRDFNVDKRLPKEVVCLYAKGDVYVRTVSIETLERKRAIFKREPSIEDLQELGDRIDKIKNKDELVRTVEDIENPLEYYDLQFLGETIKYIKVPIKDNPWMFGSLATFGDQVLAVSPDMIVHKMLYPRLISEKVATGEFNGYGEPIEMDVSMGKGLLESAYPAYIDYMLDKAANQTAKAARNTVVNLVQIQCDDMNEEEKDEVVQAILDKLTTRKGLDLESGISEYTNSVAPPAVVVTTMSGNTGAITSSQVGGDYNAGDMVDTKFYQTVLYGAFRAIKQEFGILDDNAGFSGGETLAQIQTAETDMIESAQKAVCALWEDVFNRYLQRKKMDKFVNQFRLEMNKPRTQADSDEVNERSEGLNTAEQVMNAVEGKSASSLRVFRSMLNMIDIPVEVLQEIDALISDGGTDSNDQDRDDYDMFDDDFDTPSSGGMRSGDSFNEDILNEISDDAPNINELEFDDEIAYEKREPITERLPSFSDDDYNDD